MYFKISIHVPREGHDRYITDNGDVTRRISIHVPREGHDNDGNAQLRWIDISIHVPREGHDQLGRLAKYTSVDFNPRAPRGARLVGTDINDFVAIISIHVPREGHDAMGSCLTNKYAISIHVPREGHDFC